MINNLQLESYTASEIQNEIQQDVSESVGVTETQKISKHGIVVRDRKTKEVVDFIECSIGSALKVLSGVRTQMDSSRYTASEEYINISEVQTH